MHKTDPLSNHPKLLALARQYARQIKSLKEVQEGQIESLYSEFREKYQCLKKEIEAQEGETSANSLTDSSN